MIPHTTNIPYIFFQYSIPWMPRCRKMMNRISILCYSHFPRFIIFGIKIATRIDPNTSNILEHWDVFQPMRDKHFRSVIHYSFQIQATIFFYEMQTCIQLQEFTPSPRPGFTPSPRPGATANAVAPSLSASFSHPINEPLAIISSIDFITSTSVSK